MTGFTGPAASDDRGPATWKAWMDVFADVSEDLGLLASTACPNCGARTLRAAFVGPPGLGAATGYLWCDTCLKGIAVSRMGVPPGAEVIPTGLPREEWQIRMPDYELVWPTEDDF